eukprot:symbB.v1.2.006330.t1/scaffold378.1/size217351/8
MARSSNLLVLAVVACATYMLLPSESFTAPQVLRGSTQHEAGALAQAPTFTEGRAVQVSMAATGGEPSRLPLVAVGLLAGTAAVGILALFFYGSYSGAGSGSKQHGRYHLFKFKIRKMARSSNLLVLAVVACATYMLLPSESFTAPQVLRGSTQHEAGALAQAPTFTEGRAVQVSMAATGGEPSRLPLVAVGLLAGTAAVGILALFFYGSYSGAGSVGSSISSSKTPVDQHFFDLENMARSSNLLVLAVVACATYMLLPSESFTAPQVLRGSTQHEAGALAQAPTFTEGRAVQVSMAATGGEPSRLPLVAVGLLAGTAAVGILALFFYGSYSGAGSGL